MSEDNKRELIGFFMDRNYLVTPDVLKEIPDDFDYSHFFDLVAPEIKPTSTTKVLEKSYFLELLKKKDYYRCNNNVCVLESYKEASIKREIGHFVMYFRKRYEVLRGMLETRQELHGAVSMARLRNKAKGEKVSVIGIVSEKRTSKKGNTIVKIEDMTGSINVVLRKDDKEMGNAIDELVLDEVIGITGSINNNFFVII